MDTLTSLTTVTRSLSKSLSRTATTPTVARETAYYQAKIAKVTTVADFVKDERLLTYAMKAFGLGDMTYAKGLVKKVLEGGIDSKTSLANTLSGGRYKEFAAAFNFKANGAATTSMAAAKTTTVDNYVRQALEDTSSETNPAVGLALYFERKAPNITSAYSILGDKSLLKVVQTIFDIPASSSAQPIESQYALINQKLNVADLKDPTKLSRLMQRFAVSYDATNSSASAPNILLGGNSVGLNSDLLMSIQKLR